MNDTRALVTRKAELLVAEALADTRVVAINGARQAGKSTLARLAASEATDPEIRLLDDPTTLRAAQDDPVGFVEHDGLLVIDEIQLAPELFRTIKIVVDTDPRPGRFLLTGSVRILALRDLPDALPCIETIELGLSLKVKIHGAPDRFVDAAFVKARRSGTRSELRRTDYVERIVRGGYPEAVRRTPRRRAAFFDSYLSTLIERDVTELSAIQRRGT